MHEHTREFLRRFRAELDGYGLSLRDMDEHLEEGIRHKFQESKDRPFAIDDYFRGTAAVKLDPHRLLARIAGYGDPFDIAALRGKRAPSWPAAQARILKSLLGLKKAGSKGFEEARLKLREIELLHEDDPAASEAATWSWLEKEKRPGVVVGLLSALAVHLPSAKAHYLLKLACDIVGEQLESAAGGKLATAAGRCFISVGFFREGLHILRKHALGIADLFGDGDEHAAVHYQISRAASRLGEEDLSTRALKRAVSIGRDRLRFYALQLLAFKELSTGDTETAVRLYDELLDQPFFSKASKQLKAAINHSRLAAKFAAGQLDERAVPEFEAAVTQVREVMPPRDQVAAVMDFAQFLWELGKKASARFALEAELWNVLDLAEMETMRKYAGLWEAFELPRDTRFSTLIGRIDSSKGGGS